MRLAILTSASAIDPLAIIEVSDVASLRRGLSGALPPGQPPGRYVLAVEVHDPQIVGDAPRWELIPPMRADGTLAHQGEAVLTLRFGLCPAAVAATVWKAAGLCAARSRIASAQIRELRGFVTDDL